MDLDDVAWAVRKQGSNLARLARENGLSDAALRCALKRPSRAAEEVLIRFLKVPPNTIWPDRYDANGLRLVRRGRRTDRHTVVNNSARQRNGGQSS